MILRFSNDHFATNETSKNVDFHENPSNFKSSIYCRGVLKSQKIHFRVFGQNRSGSPVEHSDKVWRSSGVGKVSKSRFLWACWHFLTISPVYLAFWGLITMPNSLLLVDFRGGRGGANFSKMSKLSKTLLNMSLKVYWSLPRRYKWVKRPFQKILRFWYLTPPYFDENMGFRTLQRMVCIFKQCFSEPRHPLNLMATFLEISKGNFF